ncbi:hypothetical protein CC78DRAFT_571573 [Lojkania enalia]|uniref:HAUS augmin-like complex subunit 6 N-terminal domain-containing protein n=1 Tax=Lojkania enalia TaxID=147567 RepID=A0A9P4JZK5_9PLEO|nr:hypothetical protein CC78DRAFT_571573 [Didymosphaeria enalia]
MSRPTSQASTITEKASNGRSRTLSLKTNTKPPINAPVDIKLFVTNLRLLNLDCRSDWPGITVHTFSSKNADQKQRIGGVEWGLFRLFEIWDPEETSQKLQPFFPPLEPLQSLNLRSALYRSLNELKKNGVLGRESVLRKSMLDECKGDKFFEILALFSTTVLKKVLKAQNDMKGRSTVAKDLSMATSLSSEKQASLLPLALAHKAALVNVLKRKDEKRRKYTEFARALEFKAGEFNQRHKQCTATPRSQKLFIPHNEAAAIKKQLQDNWVGNQKWLDVMLHGDDTQIEDGFLKMSFKDIWRMVESGGKLEGAAPAVGMLEDLQLRLEAQKTRLAKWKQFHERIREENSTSTSSYDSKLQAPAHEFKFDDHLKLQLRSMKVAEEESTKERPLRPEYQVIIAEMDAELSRISTTRYNRSVGPMMKRRGSSFSSTHFPTTRRKSHSESASRKSPLPVAEKPTKPTFLLKEKSQEKIIYQRQQVLPITDVPALPTATPLDSEATLVGHSSTILRSMSHLSQAAEAPVEEQVHQNIIQETSDPLPIASSPPPEHRSPSSQPCSYYPSEPPVLEPPPLTSEDALVEQIISSIETTTPSPVKQQPRLSLLERTRMSIARNTSFPPITEYPPPPSPPPDLPTQLTNAPLNRRTSLLERTRLSMAAMAHNPRPQPNKDKRKSRARESLYPINQFDTPRNRKSIQVIEEARSGSQTPKEDLFSDDADYERIFKSRPRIAHSPVFTPPMRNDIDGGGGREDVDGNFSGLGTRGDGQFDEGVTGVDLDDVDADEDAEGFTQAWENSPLRRAGGGLRGRGKLF